MNRTQRRQTNTKRNSLPVQPRGVEVLPRTGDGCPLPFTKDLGRSMYYTVLHSAGNAFSALEDAVIAAVWNGFFTVQQGSSHNKVSFDSLLNISPVVDIVASNYAAKTESIPLPDNLSIVSHASEVCVGLMWFGEKDPHWVSVSLSGDGHHPIVRRYSRIPVGTTCRIYIRVAARHVSWSAPALALMAERTYSYARWDMNKPETVGNYLLATRSGHVVSLIRCSDNKLLDEIDCTHIQAPVVFYDNNANPTVDWSLLNSSIPNPLNPEVDAVAIVDYEELSVLARVEPSIVSYPIGTGAWGYPENSTASLARLLEGDLFCKLFKTLQASFRKKSDAHNAILSYVKRQTDSWGFDSIELYVRIELNAPAGTHNSTLTLGHISLTRMNRWGCKGSFYSIATGGVVEFYSPGYVDVSDCIIPQPRVQELLNTILPVQFYWNALEWGGVTPITITESTVNNALRELSGPAQVGSYTDKHRIYLMSVVKSRLNDIIVEEARKVLPSFLLPTKC